MSFFPDSRHHTASGQSSDTDRNDFEQDRQNGDDLDDEYGTSSLSRTANVVSDNHSVTRKDSFISRIFGTSSSSSLSLSSSTAIQSDSRDDTTNTPISALSPMQITDEHNDNLERGAGGNGNNSNTRSSNSSSSSNSNALNSNAGVIYPLEVDTEDFEFGQPLIEHGRRNTESLHQYRLRQIKPQPVFHRWIQLLYLSLLALLSDWICFSTAANPEALESAYSTASPDSFDSGKGASEDSSPSSSSSAVTSAQLIDIFLFTNVASCFLVTDVVTRFGLQRCVQTASVVMTIGCWCRSGGISSTLHTVIDFFAKDEDARRSMSESATRTFSTQHEETNEALDGMSDADEATGDGVRLVSAHWLIIGTVLVGAAQPFFQCTPPLLSAQWFAPNERATSTAVALNFNQIGIAVAFLVGGPMASTVSGIQKYFTLITICCTVVTIGTLCQFQNLPTIPPSKSEWEKRMHNHAEPPFARSVYQFFCQTPGFVRPLSAFICSISITNIVGAFIDDIMKRGGVTKRSHIAMSGAVFEFAIVLGGVLLGGYVDRTKAYKRVTLWCLGISVLCCVPLGWTHHLWGQEPAVLVLSLLFLGFFAGPIQPINAELAVDVTFPGDETAVESVQQIGGNLMSAVLVPFAERLSKKDLDLFPHSRLLGSDIRGDAILLIAMAVGTFFYFAGFHAPLRRTMADRGGGSPSNSSAASRSSSRQEQLNGLLSDSSSSSSSSDADETSR